MVALPAPHAGMKTCRRTPWRGPSYNESSTTPMISTSSLGFGPPPCPRCRPTALSPPKKWVPKRLLTIARPRVLLHVRQREVATLENRDSHRLEIFRRQRIHVRLHVFAVGRLVSLNGGSVVPLAAAQDWDGGQRRRRHASRSAQPIEQFPI